MGGWGRPHVSDAARLSVRTFGAARNGVCFDGGVGPGGAAFGFPIPSLTGQEQYTKPICPPCGGIVAKSRNFTHLKTAQSWPRP